MIVRLFAVSLLLVLSACTVNEFPDERKGNAVAGARDRVAIAAEYLQSGENDRAMQHLKKAISMDPKSAEAHSLMAILLEREGDPRGADKHYRRAIALKPGFSQAHNNYGVFLFKRGEFRDAATNFDKASADLGYPLRAFLRALRIDAGLPQVNLEMADIAFEKKNLVAARGYYQRFLKLTEKQPQSARSLWLGIRIERRLGDRNALASYELALKRLYPDSAEYKAYVASLESGN